MTEETPSYQPGDIVNGHVLTKDNQWVPLAQSASSQSTPMPMPNYSLTYGSGQPVVVVQGDSNNTSLAPVTSLVSGLIALFFGWIPFVGLIAWVLGPLAIVFGILGLQRGKAEHKIMSWIGIVCGVIALIICVLYVLAFVGALNSSDY
jgi:hypothetical protein